MPAGTRLDLLLEKNGLVSSRQHARTLIMDGNVLVNGVKVTKPGSLVKEGARIEIVGAPKPRFVSRGGLKLERALDRFNISPEGRICLDIGASTGGFTDCLLKAGASLVFAVDVGYGQLDWTLRQDPRVIVMERVNARYLNPAMLAQASSGSKSEAPTLCVMDASFISLVKLLPAAAQCLAPDSRAEIVALVKPQFEAGPKQVGKGGVVRDITVHREILQKLASDCNELGLTVINLTYSPVKGPKGNIEFLAHIKRVGTATSVKHGDVLDATTSEKYSDVPDATTSEKYSDVPDAISSKKHFDAPDSIASETRLDVNTVCEEAHEALNSPADSPDSSGD